MFILRYFILKLIILFDFYNRIWIIDITKVIEQFETNFLKYCVSTSDAEAVRIAHAERVRSVLRMRTREQ